MMRRNKEKAKEKEIDEELADDEDYQNTKKEQEEEEDGPQKYVIEALGQIAPGIPIRWVDHPDRPYENPKVEYVRSPFPLDLMTLAYRWEGLWTPSDIELEYSRSNWASERFKYQDERDRQALAESLAEDKEYQKRVLNSDIEGMYLIIERLMADFVAGVEFKPVKGAGAFGYVKMPMTMDTKVRLAKAITDARKFRGVRVGIFSDLVGSENKHELSMAELMRMAKAEQDNNYAQLLELAGIRNSELQSQHMLPAKGNTYVVEMETKTADDIAGIRR